MHVFLHAEYESVYVGLEKCLLKKDYDRYEEGEGWGGGGGGGWRDGQTDRQTDRRTEGRIDR